MRRKNFGSALAAVAEDGRLSDYEDALDRHYFRNALAALKGTRADVRFLKGLLSAEIDHRNILNVLEAEAVGFSNDLIVDMLIPGGRIVPKRAFSTIATGGKDAMLGLLRTASRFDATMFEEALARSEQEHSLDAVVTFLKERELKMMARMSFLHPVSALPVIHYVAAKVQEVNDLRLIVRGRLAGLPTDVLEAHVLN
jgi:V/A-type H+-transporting ATPase subunit C